MANEKARMEMLSDLFAIGYAAVSFILDNEERTNEFHSWLRETTKVCEDDTKDTSYEKLKSDLTRATKQMSRLSYHAEKLSTSKSVEVLAFFLN